MFLFCFVLFCFVLLESSGGFGETPNAFIFSLNNFEGLAPFVSKVKEKKKDKAIDRRSDGGPVFGQDLFIYLDADTVWRSYAYLNAYYSVPHVPHVTDEVTVLDGHRGTFSPDEVEVFYLDPSR